jgi:hypothetical protein
LIVTTGIPAATADSMLSCRPSGLAIETTIPATSSATAASMSSDCFEGSGSEEYSTETP